MTFQVLGEAMDDLALRLDAPLYNKLKSDVVHMNPIRLLHQTISREVMKRIEETE